MILRNVSLVVRLEKEVHDDQFFNSFILKTSISIFKYIL